MSVTTRANESIINAKDCIKNAIIALNEIFIEDCWGCEDYQDNKELQDIYTDLIALKNELKRI